MLYYIFMLKLQYKHSLYEALFCAYNTEDENWKY